MYIAGGIACFFASHKIGSDLGSLVPAAGVASLQKRCTEVSMAYTFIATFVMCTLYHESIFAMSWLVSSAG
jgi:hypothetical protein